MLNMIKSDVYRIFRGKAIYISIIILFFFMALSCIDISPGFIGVSTEFLTDENSVILTPEDEKAYEETMSIIESRKIMKKYPYKLDKAIVGENANLYYIFIVITVIVFATDFSNSTIKNSISSSINRKKYYLSKLITCLIFCTGIVLLNNYGTYFLNILINGTSFSSSLFEITQVTLYQLPLMYGIISLLVCMCALFRRTAIFNTVAIPFLVAVQLIGNGIISLFKINTNIMSYEYQFSLTKLANNPSTMYILICVMIGLVYIFVFNLIGYMSFKKCEIK